MLLALACRRADVGLYPFNQQKKGKVVYLSRLLLSMAMIATVALTGCATSRSVVDPSIAASANPVQGKAVRIEKVVDARVFEKAPSEPSTPSLDPSEPTDDKIKARAIARKRNGYGKALGDVLLPENKTAANLVSDAVAEGFRASGYRVLVPGDAGFEQAIPVTADARQFWAWFTPGFWSITMSHRSEVKLDAPLPVLQSGKVVTAEAEDSRQAATESAWQEIVSKGMTELAKSVRAALQPAQ